MLPFIRFILKLFMLAFLTPFLLFPIRKNRVLLLNNILNFDAKYACNAKYLAEYMMKNYPGKFQIIYPLGNNADGDKLKKKDLITVRLGSFKYYYYALTSNFFVTTSGAISYMPFRKKQVVINTWHGGGAYKKMGLDTTNNFFYRLDCKLTEAKTTYFLSSNRYFSNIIKSSLLIKPYKILEIGLPRNDIFFSDYKIISLHVRKKYNISQDTHIILYAPTYRTQGEDSFLTHQLGPYEINTEDIINAAKKRFGGDWVFAIRLHPSIARLKNSLSNRIIDMSDHEDIQELLCAAEILINDYSSTMWDFVQMKKPCFIFATDLEKYQRNRGLYTSPSSWPFPISKTNDELIHNIKLFDQKKYASDVEKYFQWMINFENGQSCNKLCNLMENFNK